ncbi:hypothetical protein [Petroclostridium sp. X23]|uniref:hypothetical protein n=1 Tax=Petroclostridium sp. X23 TaxID=3045146 RepID=UPI0024AE6600|nr:hypothetical protein [Petroclostridium sp. X23]WHH58477.1 hypothetical protein QKW49_22190 [Petroclostridium sp. X23]
MDIVVIKDPESRYQALKLSIENSDFPVNQMAVMLDWHLQKGNINQQHYDELAGLLQPATDLEEQTPSE